MPVSLPPGTRVELEVDRRQLPGQGLYRAVTVVLGKDPGELGFVYLQKPESWQRVQARELFRVPAMLAVPIRAAGEENAPWMIGQTRDKIGRASCRARVQVPGRSCCVSSTKTSSNH